MSDDHLDEVLDLHRRHGAADVPQNVICNGVPLGWRVMTRRWGSGYWDAVIMAPPGKIGWRLADPPATTEREARVRAVAEVRAHLGLTVAWQATLGDFADALETGREPEDVQAERHRRELAAVTRPAPDRFWTHPLRGRVQVWHAVTACVLVGLLSLAVATALWPAWYAGLFAGGGIGLLAFPLGCLLAWKLSR